jgi:hypothetical protein
MEFINAGSVFDMELMESSFDLMRNPLFSLQKSFLMMPTPFVLTDAVVIKQTIKQTPQLKSIVALPSIPLKKERIIIATDTAKVR